MIEKSILTDDARDALIYIFNLTGRIDPAGGRIEEHLNQYLNIIGDELKRLQDKITKYEETLDHINILSRILI